MHETTEGEEAWTTYYNCIVNSTMKTDPECVACTHEFNELDWDADFPAEVCNGCYE